MGCAPSAEGTGLDRERWQGDFTSVSLCVCLTFPLPFAAKTVRAIPALRPVCKGSGGSSGCSPASPPSGNTRSKALPSCRVLPLPFRLF